MNLYYIKVSKVVSDIFEVESNNEKDAIEILKNAIENEEICTKFFNNTEYVFDIIDNKDIINTDITSI